MTLKQHEIDAILDYQRNLSQAQAERLTLAQLTVALTLSRLTGTPLPHVCEVMEQTQADVMAYYGKRFPGGMDS